MQECEKKQKTQFFELSIWLNDDSSISIFVDAVNDVVFVVTVVFIHNISTRHYGQKVIPAHKINKKNPSRKFEKKLSNIFEAFLVSKNEKKICWGRKKLKNAVVRETKRHFFLGFEMNFGCSEMCCNWFIPMEKILFTSYTNHVKDWKCCKAQRIVDKVMFHNWHWSRIFNVFRLKLKVGHFSETF